MKKMEMFQKEIAFMELKIIQFGKRIKNQALSHFGPISLWYQRYEHIILFQNRVNLLHVLVFLPLLTLIYNSVSLGPKLCGTKMIYCQKSS
jgi:hypothetical protein